MGQQSFFDGRYLRPPGDPERYVQNLMCSIKRKNWESFVTVIFLCFSISVAVWTSGALLAMTSDCIRFSDAVETPAIIEQCRTWKVRSGRHSSDRYSITYRYMFQGSDIHVQSDRISLFPCKRNTSDVYRRLLDAFDSNRSVTCFVNPRDPESSVFDRQFSFGCFAFTAAFPVAFGFASIACAVSLFRNLCSNEIIAKSICICTISGPVDATSTGASGITNGSTGAAGRAFWHRKPCLPPPD